MMMFACLLDDRKDYINGRWLNNWGSSEITLTRWLRKPLMEEKKQAIIKAVNELESKFY
jgi:hypothetical protein